MPRFALTAMIVRPDDLALSRITDLALGPVAGTLYSTTRYDGQITQWDITGPTLAAVADHIFAGIPIAGNDPMLSFVGDTLLSGGGVAGAWTQRTIASNGGLGGATSLADHFEAPLVQPVTITHDDGSYSVYAGQNGTAGLLHMPFDTAATPTASTVIAQATAGVVTALSTVRITDTNLLFTATTNSVTAWQVDPTGVLTQQDRLTSEDGLWVRDITDMVTVTVAGVSYVIVAGAGSDTLTVLETNATGTLQITENILDDRHTRFEGVTALATATYGDATWLFVGGADDGISAFEVLPGGRLLHRAVVADTNDMTLANISALSATPHATGLTIFAASSTEAGLTRLQLEISPDDQVIMDGTGSNVLQGGAGADVFVMQADGQADTIADFTVGEDTLDLGAWAGLRSMAQLTFTPTADGITLSYGDESLTLTSADGAPLTASVFSETDLLGPARISSDPLIGLPGPNTPAPALPDRYIPPPGSPAPVAPPDRVEDYGTGGADAVHGGIGDDRLYGQGGNDTLRGDAGLDLLFGGDGADTLWGGADDDMLFGGAGRDVDWRNTMTQTHSSNGDVLLGEAGDDQLFGQAGADHLDGGTGDDQLTGGAGRDDFIFRSGHDVITDFDPQLDTLHLDPALWSGTLTAAQAIVRFGQAHQDTLLLSFDAGHSLRINHVSDTDLLVTQTLLWDLEA